MTDHEKMRAEFEAAHTIFSLGRNGLDFYMVPEVHERWQGWKACAAQSAETIARLEKIAAAAQSDNAGLRELLDAMFDSFADCVEGGHADELMQQVRKALAQSLDTSALDAYVLKNYVVRYMRPNSHKWTSKEWAAFGVMADECRSSQLYKDGDAILVWVNKWDICRIGQMIEPDKQGE